jgi:hypothetical protein
MSVPFIDPAAAEPQLSDWPEGYVASLNEHEFDGEASDEALLAELTFSHDDMRFGQRIDLDIQQGFYFHPGNGVVGKAQGSDSGFVIGGLERLAIDVDNTGSVWWWAIENEHRYVADGFKRLEWVLANAVGPWFLTADYQEAKWEPWYWLVLRFLSDTDEAEYLAAFPEETE